MEQIDLLNKDHLESGLRFLMQVATDEPAQVSYRDGEFKVDIMYKDDDPGVIITREMASRAGDKKMVDHTLSEQARQFLIGKVVHIKLQKSRLNELKGKFNLNK